MALQSDYILMPPKAFMKIVNNVRGKRLLFLQGPMGTFFRDLNKYFSSHGATTFSICFNIADQVTTRRKNRTLYKATKAEWPKYISDFLRQNKIDKLFLFGNCRYYHKHAITAAQELGVEAYVFEEGYIRPNFVTLEQNGVNGDSALPSDANFYHQLPVKKIPEEAPANINHFKMGVSATFYYLAVWFLPFFYPYYEHHRELSAPKEFFFFWRGVFRKKKYAKDEQGVETSFETTLKKKYYFVPLQTRIDFQIKQYSNYQSIEEFISEVIVSFAQNAPQDTSLIIKHHPMERGQQPHVEFIESLAQQHGVSNRVLSYHDVHLPTCLKNAIGTITINSTVGLSSLLHGTPTIAMGTAIYDIEGLTCKDMALDDFWQHYKNPDKTLFNKFRNYVIEHTQLNGNFYGLFPKF